MRRAAPLATALLSVAGTVAALEAQPSATDARVLADLDQRIKAYVAIHQKHEDSLPKLSKESTPEQIDRHQRGLATLIQKTRAGARMGDIFTRESRALIRRALLRIFNGPSGRQLKAAIMEENPGPIKLQVNGRYPEAIPLTTMPPEVIKALPKLPEELEFRFIGARLILLDVHAHTIADFIENALP